ncbi:MAG: trigger factor [Dehalococcoidia bacterium]|nr:trigger factor [Dehalococcoidia bacterium]
MKITSEKMEHCQVTLRIEVDQGEMDKSLDKTYRRLSRKLSIPGFRKGKVPRVVLEQHVGRDTLLDEALDDLLPELYNQALDSEKLDPVDKGQVEILQKDPAVFKAIVPLKPEVELGNYHDIKLDPDPVIVKDEEMDAVVQKFREEQGVWNPVERPSCMGDLLVIDVDATIDGKPFLDHNDVAYEMKADSIFPVQGFAAQIEGMSKNEEKTFTLPIPEDYRIKEFSGKEVQFHVTLKEIKEKELPEISDELARNASYDSLEALRDKIKEDLHTRAEAKSHADLIDKAIASLVEISHVDFPPTMENSEIDSLVEQQASRLGYNKVSDYLVKLPRPEEELREDLRPAARKRIIASLVLGKLAQEEGVTVDSSEIDSRIKEMMGDSPDEGKMKKILSVPQIRESVKQSLLTQKTIDRLIKIITTRDAEEKEV